jgi:hypothetical protein
MSLFDDQVVALVVQFHLTPLGLNLQGPRTPGK